MTFRLRSRKLVAATGILAVVGIGGGVAYAYPPATPLVVAASATSPATPGGPSTVTVTIAAVDPTCSTRISIDGVDVAIIPPGQTTATASIPGTQGRHRVRARNTGCQNGDNEKARADFTILTQAAISPSGATVQRNKNAKFDLSGLAPVDATVTVSAVRSGGGSTVTAEEDEVDRRGNAKVKFKFPQNGTWVLTATINGSVVATTNVTVTE
jgi:hypothetical protein